MNSKFYVGDIVRVTEEGHLISNRLPVGLTGCVARICDEISDDVVSVNFEISNWHKGHNSNGYFPESNSYWNFDTHSESIERASFQQPANIKELF